MSSRFRFPEALGPLVRQPGVRVLPLENFPRLALAAFWPGAASAEVKSLVEFARATARTVKCEENSPDLKRAQNSI